MKTTRCAGQLARYFHVSFCLCFSLQVLSLAEEAGVQEITQSYRELVKLWHPDHNPSKDAEAKFMKIHEAYEVLLRRYRPNRFKWLAFASHWLTRIVTCRTNSESRGHHVTQNAVDLKPLFFHIVSCVVHDALQLWEISVCTSGLSAWGTGEPWRTIWTFQHRVELSQQSTAILWSYGWTTQPPLNVI